MEAQGDPFRRGLPTLQTSLTHPELPPCPRHLQSEDLFRLLEVAGTWGKFFCWFWEVGRFCSVRLSRSFGRRVAQNAPRVVPLWLKDNFYEECRLIPPHQSLARQLPPKGKPSLRCANRANRTLNRGMSSRSALIRRLRRHLPPRRGRLWCVTFSSEFVFWKNMFRRIYFAEYKV